VSKSNRDDGRRTAQDAVCDVVGDVIPSAIFYGIDEDET
jgi:hypothetical protein